MSETAPKVKWDPTISLGSIVSLIGLMVATVAGALAWNTSWNRMDGRVGALEGSLKAVVGNLEASVASVRQAQVAGDSRNREADAETRVAIRRVDDKLTALLIQGYSRGTNLSPTPIPQ